jgi:hypothetical protein
MVEAEVYAGDVTHVCQHCHQPIRWSESQKKWFHILNLTAFCTGYAGPEATPADLELTP